MRIVAGKWELNLEKFIKLNVSFYFQKVLLEFTNLNENYINLIILFSETMGI